VFVGAAAAKAAVEHEVADRPHGLLTGHDLDGNEVALEADELAARCFQHELDHLDGVLLLERLDTDTRKQAMRTIRNLMLDGGLRRRGPNEHLL
jgi:peptide deformylase